MKVVDEDMVVRLYELSQRSLIAVIAVMLVVSSYLYPFLGGSVVVWGIVIVLFSLLRLYSAFYFKHNKTRFSMRVWYRIFLVATIVTALGVSLLGAYFIYGVNESEQLLIAALLVGFSASAISSLYPDVRLSIAYISILILPLILSLALLGGKPLLLLMVMTMLYYTTQIIIALNVFRQKQELERKQQEVIRAQEELLQNRETLEYFYTQAPVGIFSCDLDMKVIDCNDAFMELFQLNREEIIGLDLRLLPDLKPLEIVSKALKEGIQKYTGPYFSTKGLQYWVEAKSFPIYNEAKEVIGGITMIENKTTEHEAVEKLRYLASRDPLTNLKNRRGFRAFMESLLQDRKHKEYYSLLFYLDLNRFKYINDSLGHTFGDKLLHEVAMRLQDIVKSDEGLSRLGGDEFVILVPFASKEKDEAQKKAQAYASKIHRALESAFIIDGVRLYVKSSIGIVMIEPGFDNIDEIVRHADISMYQAKRHGEDHISFYNTKLDQERKTTFALQQDLVHALEHDDFELYLQPIMRIDDNAVRAAEALIRWRHPQKGIVEPAEFIPLAIELGIINEIGWWVLRAVCRTIASWKEEGAWNLEYISINLNAKQLIKNNFIERFFGELDAYKIDTEDIKVEITETSLIDNFELTQEVIHELQERGIKCVIDDFGTGYSSLSYLKKLSFSVLKIDREFIFDLENNDENETLVRTIVEIAKQFKYSVVVEGIETSEQREIIRAIDKNLSYQGFLSSRPVPIEDFKKSFIIYSEKNPSS